MPNGPKSNSPAQKKVNPVREIRKSLNMTQYDFAVAIGRDEKYVSMLETGKRPVSNKVAKEIIKLAPPGTRIEWLTGKDPHRTEKDLFDFEWASARSENEQLDFFQEELLKRLAKLAGYRLERRELSLDEFLCGRESYIFIDELGKETGLKFFGSGGVDELLHDFFDYAVFRLKRTINKKNLSINWTITTSEEKAQEEGGDNG